MSQNYKPEIEELLNAYIDGELSERQQNELKRLVQHDSHIADHLERLTRQREFLSALPVESAPDNIEELVRAKLERKMLLDDYSDQPVHAAPPKTFLRRTLASAAMLLLPLGILGWVIYTLIMPAEETTKPPIAEKNVAPDDSIKPYELITEDSVPEFNVQYAFNGRLDIKTAETIAVNSFIEKAIFNNGLIDSTIPKRNDSSTNYSISCNQNQLSALLGDLQGAWGKFESVCLVVYDDNDRAAVVINSITPPQMRTIFESSETSSRIAVAKNFADINAESALDGYLNESDLSTPIKPVLTGPEKTKVESDLTVGMEKINLIITVSTL